jgi:Protein of unknown function (DUF3349)
MALPNLLQKVLDWLHAGYPEGVPQEDYYALLAFLARSLRPEEVTEVVTALEAEKKVGRKTTTADVTAAIEAVTASPALRKDVRRVEERLREAGWELETVAER